MNEMIEQKQRTREDEKRRLSYASYHTNNDYQTSNSFYIPTIPLMKNAGQLDSAAPDAKSNWE